MTPAAEPRRPKVAVIDDDPAVRELIRSTLSREGLDVELWEGSPEFLSHADPGSCALVLCDLMLPEMNGVELLTEVRKKHPSLPFIIISGQGTVSTAVDAMKAGALDFLEKPFRLPQLLGLIRQALAEPSPDAPPAPANLAGRSRVWLEILEKARRVAVLSDTVLLRGETGTGKEVLARYIAASGPRASHPFVSINCAALPESLIESELFGHVRGAFTGATAPRRGLFEEAGGGTLLLDEVGAMPLASQGKLLRVLEERLVKRVGENKAVPVDVRILASTNADLEAAIARRAFREDLYYRLAVITLRIPPLRERGEDVLFLAAHFLRQMAPAGVPARTISPEAQELLVRHPFPGNVRELKHALAQACALSTRPELCPEDFHLLIARPEPGPATWDSSARSSGIHHISREMVRDALERSGNNRVEAARRLGVSRSTLYRLLRRFPGCAPAETMNQ
ncbi:MAG: sigma-54-dependent transcriptional regulator [Thermoanaerobaculia bacterium]